MQEISDNNNHSHNDKKIKTNESSRVEEQAWNLALPIIKDSGYFIWDVIFEKEGAMWYLRVLFDSEHDLRNESGITSEECEKITAPLNAILDKQKFIENVDILEIGSPGLTRRLRCPRHFNACLGFPVRVVMRGEKGKTEVIYGTLNNYNENAGIITVQNTGTQTTPIKNKQKKENIELSVKDNYLNNQLIEIEIKKCVRVNLDL